MRRALCLLICLVAASGCAAVHGPAPIFDNPSYVPIVDYDYLWDQTVDVVDDYFRIERERRVREVGGQLTIGRLDTFPEVGSTLFEPWRGDSANPYEKLEATLQTIRRRAVVVVMPAEGGFLVDVSVFKELEDMPRAEHATAGAATFRYDTVSQELYEPVGEQGPAPGWIPLGRDAALEQRILDDLLDRVGPQAQAAKQQPRAWHLRHVWPF